MSMTHESEDPMTATFVAAEFCRDAACAGQYEPTRRPLCGDEKMSFATAERLDRIAANPPSTVGTAPIYRFGEGKEDR